VLLQGSIAGQCGHIPDQGLPSCRDILLVDKFYTYRQFCEVVNVFSLNSSAYSLSNEMPITLATKWSKEFRKLALPKYTAGDLT